MKTGRGLVLIAILLAGVWAASASAEPEGGEEITCEQYFTLGESIMRARQTGVAMPEMMKIAEGNALFRALIITAYEKGLYSTKEYQKREINEFANDVYMACLKRDGR